MIRAGYAPQNESADLSGVSGFFVTFIYDGDALSDYRATVIVIADSEAEAIKIAKKYVPQKYDNPRYFKIDHSQGNNLGGKSGTLPCLATYLKKYPHSNFKIMNSKGFVRR